MSCMIPLLYIGDILYISIPCVKAFYNLNSISHIGLTDCTFLSKIIRYLSCSHSDASLYSKIILFTTFRKDLFFGQSDNNFSAHTCYLSNRLYFYLYKSVQ